ncbi:hypothetical protein MHTCC0001_05780 [Flavobacteriaceae bacterium MHTCC 0001]
MIDNKRIIFSCVLDYSPTMAIQTFIWLTNLLAIKIPPSNIYIHVIDSLPIEFLNYLNSKEVNIIKKKPFNIENRYCNKLLQLETFQKVKNYDYVFLMDCDTAVIDLIGLKLEEEIYAKVVDFPLPSIEKLNELFELNNFNISETNTTFSLNDKQLTDWNNCNGGLYIISSRFIKELKPMWEKYALWCIQKSDVLSSAYAKHADQVGFALAMASLYKTVTHLGVEWNYPIHIENSKNVKPKIIHFHTEINEHLQIKNIENSVVNEQIELINKRINDHLSKNLSNSLFWDYRYNKCPDLGSGVGSRGEVLKLKQTLLNLITHGYTNREIVDVGCGDLELMKVMPFKNYLGLDVSNEAIKLAGQKRPDWKFKNTSITDETIEEVDLVMCFDVLIHQSDKQVFENIVKSLVIKANKRIIIGAYNSLPSYDSTITHYHNAIFDEVNKYGKFDELAVVKTYRDVSVLVGTVHKSEHNRDLASSGVNKAFSEVDRPDLLQFIVDVSRFYFGFYTAHYPRVFEYTWILKQLEEKKGIQVLDIGAGVCPIPLCLKEMGNQVTTVDSHPTSRIKQNKANWNEWGFLDYSIFDKDIKSIHKDFTKVKTFKRFDCIYSISVIEHMPRQIRSQVLKRVNKLLRKNGELLLTIDIEPKTDNIWNCSEGKQVESQKEHGTISSFKIELKENGFVIHEEFVQRDIFKSKTDVLYIKAILKRKRII